MADIQHKAQAKLVEYLEREAKDADRRQMRASADAAAYQDLAHRMERTCFSCGEYFYRDENFEAHVATCGREPEATCPIT
jgi:hypothetical protein